MTIYFNPSVFFFFGNDLTSSLSTANHSISDFVSLIKLVCILRTTNVISSIAI